MLRSPMNVSEVKYAITALRALERKGFVPAIILGESKWDLFAHGLRLSDRLEFAIRSAKAYPGSVRQAFSFFDEELLWDVRKFNTEFIEQELTKPLSEDVREVHSLACKHLNFTCPDALFKIKMVALNASSRILELPGAGGRGSLELMLRHPELSPANFTLVSSDPRERALMALAISLLAGDVDPSPVKGSVPQDVFFDVAIDWGVAANGNVEDLHVGGRITP